MTPPSLSVPPLAKGLSARLLVLTVAFVMLSEVLIYVPSIARFRLTYLEGRIAAAYLASLVLKERPEYVVDDALEQELLKNTQLRMMALKRKTSRTLILSEDMPPKLDASFDLRDAAPVMLIMHAFEALMHGGDRVIRAIGDFPDGSDGFMEVMLDEKPLYYAMLDYSTNILKLSIAISLLTAGLVYLALHVLFVRPMRRITNSMVMFRNAPENVAGTVVPSTRSDEIGTAQRELAAMQQDLRSALRQKTHLAALGSAVSKINHDLRNVLATAHLVSDRLATSDDPEVKRATPVLVRAIDHAIALCTETLNFGKAEERAPERMRFPLGSLVDDVAQHVGLPDDGRIVWRSTIANGLEVEADREQLFRALLNLGRNSIEAIKADGEIRIAAARSDGKVEIDLEDTGAGLPARAREHLFEPFSGSTRSGGVGLGLAIARELVRGHGGDLELVKSDEAGTTFRISLPDDPTTAKELH